jgi:hypothetical protein
MSSIYIPRIGSEITGDMIMNYLDELKNYITRMDFTPIAKTSLFDETIGDYVSVFIHFDQEVELTGMMQDIRYCMKQGNPYKYYPFSSYEFWLLLPNKQPIQQTSMNNSQIVENCRLLEKKVLDQSAQIEDLTKKLDGVQNVIYQLIGGVYNQRTQADMINTHMGFLYPGKYNAVEDSEIESKWSIWPTTRQGDENERRIEFLERALGVVHPAEEEDDPFRYIDQYLDPDEDDEELRRKHFADIEDAEGEGMERELNESEREYFRTSSKLHAEMMSIDESISDPDSDDEDDNDLSTHSSMPELMDCFSNDEDSMTDDFTSVSSISTSERVRNTFELCGNE